MRIRKISCHKVIVELTNNDLDKLDLDLQNRPQENIHNFLFSIMEKVHIQTGFDPYNGGQVIVEATPSERGMELVISKIPSKSRKMTREDFSRIRSIKVKEKRALKNSDYKTVFVFNTYDDFENTIKRIDENILLYMTLYRNKTRYALICDGKLSQMTKDIICEYASKWGRYTPCYCNIRESWQEIASGENLLDMAHNIKGIL